ncbi:unnamed protein product [Timema podura]|uniref:Uncharacterized protein n=1 Tax=Timema podura TaxID=61482 RepID=A0ABN7NN64_TIMPD|nr:unnamed protein product [Timema podura]
MYLCISLSEAVVQRGARDSACARVCVPKLYPALPRQVAYCRGSPTHKNLSPPTPNSDAASTPNGDQQEIVSQTCSRWSISIPSWFRDDTRGNRQFPQQLGR